MNKISNTLKKAKYNDAVDEISGGAATEKDKADAYQIIDAYIKGDKALEQDSQQQTENEQSLDEALKNTDEVKAAQEFLDQQKTMFMQMSYAEFEAYILKFNPVAGKKEIKTAFNEMHKADGKKVSITDADENMTEAQQQMWAINILQNPKSYEDFSKALKILNPKISESEIRKMWDNRNK
jgi:ribosomal protein L23